MKTKVEQEMQRRWGGEASTKLAKELNKIGVADDIEIDDAGIISIPAILVKNIEKFTSAINTSPSAWSFAISLDNNRIKIKPIPYSPSKLFDSAVLTPPDAGTNWRTRSTSHGLPVSNTANTTGDGPKIFQHIAGEGLGWSLEGARLAVKAYYPELHFHCVGNYQSTTFLRNIPVPELLKDKTAWFIQEI